MSSNKRMVKKNVILFFVTLLMQKCILSQETVVKKTCFFKSESANFYGFNGFIRKAFITRYNSYFSKACDVYYREVRFTIDTNGSINNLEIENSPDYIVNFLKDVLKSANGKFNLPFNKEKSESRVFVLPIHFRFTENCSDSSKMLREKNIIQRKQNTPVYKGDFVIDKETDEMILLWPIVCNGPFIHRNIFDID